MAGNDGAFRPGSERYSQEEPARMAEAHNSIAAARRRKSPLAA